MLPPLLSPTAGAVLVVIFILGYALYRAALPRPIPGIPYHKASASRIVGDAWDMVKYNQQHGTATDWLTLQGSRLNSPIYQLFLKPFSNPIVLITDPRETQDVLLRRAKDFDRSVFFADLFVGEIPDHHIVQPTNDKFRRGRRLLADTMTTGFLHGVAAPSLHKNTLKLMELWRVKTDLADGHAFWAADDIQHFALDAIWDTALGSQLNSLGQAIELLKSSPEIDMPESVDEPISFPTPEFSTAVRSMKIITHLLDKATVSPVPRQTHWYMRLAPSYRRARAQKEQLIQESLDDAKARLLHTHSEKTDEFDGITCATDHLVRREAQAAAKERRAPAYDSRSARDELHGFLIGGHDTTATTLMWMVKLLADHAAVQAKLRGVLAAAFAPATASTASTASTAAAAAAPPGPAQIAALAAPYADAVVAEVLRRAQTASLVVRKAVRATQLLGCHIPRGVDVYLMVNGPGYAAPSGLNATIPEAARSPSSREHRARAAPDWDPADVAAFRPERWLKTDADGRVVFDGQAGPMVQFGGGVRGCFGRKLAYLELRIFLVLLVWTYELLPVPEKLGSYQAVATLTNKPRHCYIRLQETGKSTA